MKKLALLVLVNYIILTAYADSNIYIDANIGSLNPPATGYNGSLAYNLNAGYIFNKYFGLEGGLTYSALNGDLLGINLGGNYWSLDAAVKVFYLLEASSHSMVS